MADLENQIDDQQRVNEFDEPDPRPVLDPAGNDEFNPNDVSSLADEPLPVDKRLPEPD